MCTGHISCYPYVRTHPHTVHEWILLIVTSERNNQNRRFGFSGHLRKIAQINKGF